MTEKIPLAGVIGNPIGHSKSPKLHGHWLHQRGINGHYVPLHVHPDRLAFVLKVLPDMGFVGVNITIPYKQAVLEWADEVTDQASRIGAANTLTFLPNGRFQADNTDAYGFMQNLHQNAPNWVPAQGPAVVLGAGGAARAVLVALLDAGVPQIFLTNRTFAKAEQLAAEFGDKITAVAWEQTEILMAQAHALINTTSLGMAGQDDFPFSLKGLQKTALVNDIVYVPLETPFLAAAKAQGCQTVDGLGMLLHQAVPGFARWFGQTPILDDQTRQAVLA